jgi:hypothetical protein
VFGNGTVNLSTRPPPDADQSALAAQLVTRAPTAGGFKTTVEIVRDYVDADHGALRETANSFALAPV